MVETASSRRPPKHRQIFEDLRSALLRGDFVAGDRLPTEAELSASYGASRATATRALRDLAAAGLVTRRQGSGTYAGNAARRQSPTIAYCPLFVDHVSSLPHVERLIHHHLVDIANAHAVDLLVQCLQPQAGALRDAMLGAAESIVARGIDGVLYYPAELPPEQMHYNEEVVRHLCDCGVTVVLVDRDIVAYPQRSDLTRIGFDNRRGGYLITDHLADMGCRRIAFVGIPGVSTAVEDRMAGYHEALRHRGLIYADNFAQCIAEPDEAFCRELIRAVQPDAIVCKSDRFAALVGRHLTCMGLRIGLDVKLAGFDDDPVASLLPVPLTTVRLDARKFAEAAFEAVQLRIKNPAMCARQIIIDCELAIRLSTRPSAKAND